jgi:4-hydroxy-tetrahydrodipicolinate reductase
MDVIIAGYGKMGRLIEATAVERGFEIAAIVDPLIAGSAIPEKAAGAVVIDFTHPAAVVDNIKRYTELGLDAVIGTTGWYEKLPDVEKWVADAGTALFYAPNFSIGVAMLYKICNYAAELFDKFPEYDVGGFEAHHAKKADSPSGTARSLAEQVVAHMSRKKRAVYEMQQGMRREDELHFASVRAGSIPGTHTLFFDSPADTIEITHRARSREGFASGAVAAAAWLAAEKRQGVFTMEDLLG